MTLFSRRAAALVLAVLAPTAGQAGTVFFEETGNHYTFVSDAATYQDAATAAGNLTLSFMGESFSGFLATITTKAENDFVSALGGEGWLGALASGNDGNGASQGAWKWDEGPEAGDPMNFTNWADGEPNNLNRSEFRLVMKADGTWNDIGETYVTTRQETYCVDRWNLVCFTRDVETEHDRLTGYYVEFDTSAAAQAKDPIGDDDQLAPVPLPNSLSALLLGCLGLVTLRRRTLARRAQTEAPRIDTRRELRFARSADTLRTMPCLTSTFSPQALVRWLLSPMRSKPMAG